MNCEPLLKAGAFCANGCHPLTKEGRQISQRESPEEANGHVMSFIWMLYAWIYRI